MKKFVCSVCGYVYEGESAPAACPLCGAPADKFVEQKEENLAWADQHVVGVAQGVDEEIVQGLRENFNGECSEVGMYLAMARVAFREGYPEIGLYWERLLMKKQNTLQSLQNCWAKWLPIPPRRIWKCVSLRKTVHVPARRLWQQRQSS